MKEIALGIDIGGTFTKFGFADEHGNTLAEDHIPTTGHPDVEEYIKTLYNAIENLRASLNHTFSLVGVGIGAPNANIYHGTIEHAVNLDWKGIVPFCELFKKYYNLPMVITNDANAAAIGEMVYGGAKNMQNFIMITLGTGLGSGIVINKQLVYGHTGFAGELGHTSVFHDGRVCGTGRKGCLEAYASATGIRRTIFEMMAESLEDSPLRQISFNDMTGEMITEAARKQDPIAVEAFRRTGQILGEKLAEFILFSSPEAIFLFGGLAKAGDLIFEPTKKYMEESLMQVFQNSTQLLPSALENRNAAVLGACALVWQELPRH